MIVETAVYVFFFLWRRKSGRVCLFVRMFVLRNRGTDLKLGELFRSRNLAVPFQNAPSHCLVLLKVDSPFPLILFLH